MASDFPFNFEDAIKQDDYHLNFSIAHEFDLTPAGASFWIEGTDRNTPGFNCHSGYRCIGMELTNISQASRNEFNILNLEDIVGDDLFISIWHFFPADFSLHNFVDENQNWLQLINPFFTGGPAYAPYSSMNIVQPDPDVPVFDLSLTYRDQANVWSELGHISNYALKRGQWFNTRYYVHRHQTLGIIRVWIDGVPLFDVNNISTKHSSITNWFTTPAKIYYDVNDTFSPYTLWVDDLTIGSSPKSPGFKIGH